MEKAIQYDSNRKSLIQITSDVTEAATHPVTSAADFLYLFYTPSPSSQARERRHLSESSVVPTVILPRAKRRCTPKPKRLADWGIFATGHRYESLSAISHPVLVVNGNNDIMIPTVNSLILQQQIPNAQSIIWLDSPKIGKAESHEVFAGRWLAASRISRLIRRSRALALGHS